MWRSSFAAEKRSGSSQFALAAELGIDRTSMSSIEAGHVPRCRTQRALAERLGLPVTELIPRVAPPNSILEGMRDDRRMTIAEACIEIGISPPVLIRAEAGAVVALRVRRAISTFYGVPIAHWYRPKLDTAVAA